METGADATFDDDATDTAPHGGEETISYFDGMSSRRRKVRLVLGDRLEIIDDDRALAAWPYVDIRRVDGLPGTLRATCLTAAPLTRLEVRDEQLAAELSARCQQLDENAPGRGGAGAIVGWSLAALASIVTVVAFGIPFAADRLTPLVPQAFERRLGEVAEKQIQSLFFGKVCAGWTGQAALGKLADAIKRASDPDTSFEIAVLSSPIANAVALPGGKIFLLQGLLAKARDADEIAGVLAHEVGHLKHRDATRKLIYNGGTSFLVGLLFGDITGSGVLTFASRSLITASYSRNAERDADSYSIEVMRGLGRSPKPMGELLSRIGAQKSTPGAISLLSSHPLTDDRLARMSSEDRPPSGPALLTPAEWTALQAICGSNNRPPIRPARSPSPPIPAHPPAPAAAPP